jgi:hypothetical protein
MSRNLKIFLADGFHTIPVNFSDENESFDSRSDARSVNFLVCGEPDGSAALFQSPTLFCHRAQNVCRWPISDA